MNRRSLLKLLAGAGAALVLDPERLLWVPGAKTVFIPKPIVEPSPRMLVGMCIGMPIYLDDIDQTSMSGLIERGPNLYRHVQLLPNRHVGDGFNTIFSVPGGKLEVLVKGCFFPTMSVGDELL